MTPEERKAYNRAYYLKNKEKIVKNNTSYNKDHRKLRADIQKKYYGKNREKILAYYQTSKGLKGKRISTWKQRGIISDDYDKLYERYVSTEKCEICEVSLTTGESSGTRRCLDHDHATGEVRAVVCHSCNARIR